MIIDVTPTIRQANEIETIAMLAYGDTERYVFMRGDVEHSVQFTPRALEEFIPKRTVSEMLKSWYESLIRDYNYYQNAVNKREHPVWTTTMKDPDSVGLGAGYNYKMITVPYKLNDEQVKNFQWYADRAKAKIQPITFWKIVLE